MTGLRLIDNLPEDFQEEFSEELARGGLWTAFSISTRTGLKVIDSPYEPRGEAQRVVQQSGVKTGQPVLLLGTGSGYISRVVVEEQFTPALGICRSRALIEANVRRLNKHMPSNDGEITLAADDNAERVWNEHIQPFLQAHPDAAIIRHPRETAAFPGFYGSLDLRLARWRDGFGNATLSREVKRLLFVGSGALFERELREEFTMRGIHVSTIDQNELQGLSVEGALQLLDTHGPDLVLSTNCRGSDETGLLPEACELMGATWATWLLDDPRYLLKPDEFEGTGRKRRGFCWDRNGIDGWRSSGFPNAHLLPLATNEKLFSPGQGIDELTGRVVFVGSPRFASGFGFFAGLDGSDAALKISRALESGILSERRSPTDEVVKYLLETLDSEKTLDIEARRRLPAFAIQQANLVYRVKYLNALAELKPVVFGTGWEGMLDERIELRAPLDFYTELPRLYKTDAVHISLTNLQMRSHPNQRPFDVGACGRAVLNDWLESLPQLFGADLGGDMTFSSELDLVEKAKALVADPIKRSDLGERLRDKVLEQHTIRHRVDEILRVCQSQAESE